MKYLGWGRVPVLKHLILQYFFIYVNYINHTMEWDGI